RLGDLEGVLVLALVSSFEANASLEVSPYRQADELGVLVEVVQGGGGIAGQVLGGERDRVQELLDVLVDDPVKELVLVAEMGVDRLLVGFGGGGDSVDPCAGQSACGELFVRGVQQSPLGVGRVRGHNAKDTKPSAWFHMLSWKPT